MEENILTTIKKMLGLTDDNDAFDMDVLVHINSAFSELAQLGVNDSAEFTATEESEWSDYIAEGSNLEMIKKYIFMKVKLFFDTPTSSHVADSLEREIAKLEWRINVAVETDCI